MQTHQGNLNTITETHNIGKPERSNKTHKASHWHKRKNDIDIIRRIISEKKKHFAFSQERKLESKTKKVNDLLANILTNDTLELNDLIYAGVKLVC